MTAHDSEALREALAERAYTALEWSGCDGSRWERVPNDFRRKWYDIADALLPVVAEQVTRAREEALIHARACVTQYVATSEKWRYDRVIWAFGIMLGEIPAHTPEPLSPADEAEIARRATTAKEAAVSELSEAEREALRGLLQWHVVSDLDDLERTVARIVADRTAALTEKVDRLAGRESRLLVHLLQAADELDTWDGHPSPVLDGCSPGGVVRWAIRAALGDDTSEATA